MNKLRWLSRRGCCAVDEIYLEFYDFEVDALEYFRVKKNS